VNTAILGALITLLAMSPIALRAEDQKGTRTYHDKQHNDDHQWNNHEDQAYKMYAEENHRKATSFVKLKDNDQQAYCKYENRRLMSHDRQVVAPDQRFILADKVAGSMLWLLPSE
jgi:type III secretory pathway component EscR